MCVWVAWVPHSMGFCVCVCVCVGVCVCACFTTSLWCSHVKLLRYPHASQMHVCSVGACGDVDTHTHTRMGVHLSVTLKGAGEEGEVFFFKRRFYKGCSGSRFQQVSLLKD